MTKRLNSVVIDEIETGRPIAFRPLQEEIIQAHENVNAKTLLSVNPNTALPYSSAVQ